MTIVRRTIPIVAAKKKSVLSGSKSELFQRANVLRAAMGAPPQEQGDGGALETIRRYADRVKNPKTAIRAKCVECSGGSLKEVAECKIVKCALHPFRMGQNPFHKKTRERLDGTDEDDDDNDTEDENTPEES